ncbi:hypothetical protein LV84_01390 [Algoriphagus ratkowskyi]|uniref:Uncharacterized protein n=1 Tax=Algoriphagus ratkowskyi TaxID=57028 RepID=A0A2W7RXP1_9BACT|nr:hypothetical protein [Algoriphagus ratkowskyi]PZX59359.1 hypothetical protein LV84_01390 [Algoriphagus ratkowskyi]TXD77375.1 hypothetical protein ESW18_11240 [Algoriphagus ratkowskyi]
MSIDQIHQTTGLIHHNDTFVGSSILFPWKGELCSITAGHNFYGKNFDLIPTIGEWYIVDHFGNSHPVITIMGDLGFAKTHDIVFIKLDCQSVLTDFISPKFCSIPINPKYSFMFRGRYKNSPTTVTHRKILYNSTLSQTPNYFYCDIDKSLLMNDAYKSGSDWLGGWSGSGLFIDNHDELICIGSLCEIPNKGNDAQLLFSSVRALELLGVDLEAMDAADLDFDRKLNNASLSAILNAVDEETVMAWEANNQNSPQLGFLNRKLEEVYPEKTLQFNKSRIIKQLLTGKCYLSAELSKNEHLFEIYRNVYKVYDLESKQFYVNSKQEALASLTSIKKEYEKYLSDSLRDTFSATDIKLLAVYGVSEWISDCSLDFLRDG